MKKMLAVLIMLTLIPCWKPDPGVIGRQRLK